MTAFEDEFKLKAVAINSAHGDEAGCSQEKLKVSRVRAKSNISPLLVTQGGQGQ